MRTCVAKEIHVHKLHTKYLITYLRISLNKTIRSLVNTNNIKNNQNLYYSSAFSFDKQTHSDMNTLPPPSSQIFTSNTKFEPDHSGKPTTPRPVANKSLIDLNMKQFFRKTMPYEAEKMMKKIGKNSCILKFNQ